MLNLYHKSLKIKYLFGNIDEMNKRYLLVYDYFLTASGAEHYGINFILIKYLKEKKYECDVLKYKFSISPLFVIFNKIPNLIRNLLSTKYNYIICYNCFNALLMFCLKVLLFQRYKVIFVSLDFSKKRFSNFLLDRIFILIDYLASIFSDEIWNSSLRVKNYRDGFIKNNKNFYMPNIPNYEKKFLRKFNKFTIVNIAFLGNGYNFEEVFETFNYIKENDIQMYIIGDGEMREYIYTKIKEHKLENNIFLTGYLEHSFVREIIEKSHCGLALYSGNFDFNFWGDSLKIREFTYFNLPVITTSNVYNSIEVINENLGIVINEDKNLLSIIKDLHKNISLYNSIVSSSVKYNLKFSTNNFLDQRFSKF